MFRLLQNVLIQVDTCGILATLKKNCCSHMYLPSLARMVPPEFASHLREHALPLLERSLNYLVYIIDPL